MAHLGDNPKQTISLSNEMDNAKIGDTVTMHWEDNPLPIVGKTYNRTWDWSKWKVIAIKKRQVTFEKVEGKLLHRD